MSEDTIKQQFKIVINEINGIKYTIINDSLSIRENVSKLTINIYKPPNRYQKQKIVIISNKYINRDSPLSIKAYPSSVIIFAGVCDDAYMFIYKIGKETFDMLQESNIFTKKCIMFGNRYPWVSEIIECKPIIE